MNKKRIIASIISILVIVVILKIIPELFKLIVEPVQIYPVNIGELVDEEESEVLIIRNEKVLSNGKNTLEKDKKEAAKVSKGETVAKYLKTTDKKIQKKIEELSAEIEKTLAEQEINSNSAENILANNRIENILEQVNKLNSQNRINEIAKQIDEQLLEKAKISGEFSKKGTKLKKLIEEKQTLEKNISQNANTINTPVSGLVSYNVDGYEEKLKTGNFEYLTKELIDNIEIKNGTRINSSDKNVKVIDSFETYLVTILKSENSKKQKEGNEIEIQIANTEKMKAKIEYIKEVDKNSKIFVFKVDKNSEFLTQYRKIQANIIWWSESGIKVSNKAIVNYEGQNYVVKQKSRFQEIVPIKILKATSEYSLVESYTTRELYEKYKINIDDVPILQIFDEIIVNPKLNQQEAKKYNFSKEEKQEKQEEQEKTQKQH
ncbi:MAG: HlyD family efflux transporter periplasmic adaptor subunit [Clostridium sp.]